MSTDTSTYIITRLKASNYFNWQFRLEMLLKEKGIWKTVSVEDTENPDDAWIKADEKTLSTISLLVDDDQIQHIRDSRNARFKDLTLALVRSKIMDRYRKRKERDDGNQIDKTALKVTNFGGHRKLITCYFCKQRGHHRNKC